MTWIVLLVIALGVYAFIQLAAVMQLTTSLKGNEEEVVTEKDNKINAKLMFLFGILFFGFFIWQVNEYSKDLLPESASEHGKLTDALWDVNIYIITIVFFV